MRVLLFVFAFVWSARPAEACGFWSMHDREKQVDVGYHVNAGAITRGKRRVGTLYLDVESKQAREHGMRVVRGKQVVYDITDGKLRKRGKVVATIDGAHVTFGKRTYTIELTEPHQQHEVLAWKLRVTRGSEQIVLADDAMALCDGPESTRTQAQREDEVRRRVIYYLAWRELGA